MVQFVINSTLGKRRPWPMRLHRRDRARHARCASVATIAAFNPRPCARPHSPAAQRGGALRRSCRAPPTRQPDADRPSTRTRPSTRDPTVAGGDAYLIRRLTHRSTLVGGSRNRQKKEPKLLNALAKEGVWRTPRLGAVDQAARRQHRARHATARAEGRATLAGTTVAVRAADTHPPGTLRPLCTGDAETERTVG